MAAQEYRKNDEAPMPASDPAPDLGATLLRVAWLAIALGVAAEGLLLLLGTGFGVALGLRAAAARLRPLRTGRQRDHLPGRLRPGPLLRYGAGKEGGRSGQILRDFGFQASGNRFCRGVLGVHEAGTIIPGPATARVVAPPVGRFQSLPQMPCGRLPGRRGGRPPRPRAG